METSNNGNGGPVSGETGELGDGDDHAQVQGNGDVVIGGGGEHDQGSAGEVGGPSRLPNVPGASRVDALDAGVGGGGGGGDGHEQLVVMVDVHNEADPNGTISNDNFTEITKEGVRGCACNICSEAFDQPSKVKRHITMKHLKPASDIRGKRGREGEDEAYENKKHKFIFSESILDEFERTGMFITSTQVEEDRIEVEEESTMDDTIIRAIPKDLNQAVEIIKELDLKVKKLEEELKLSKDKSASQDILISTKDDALLVFQGTVNSLEEETKNLSVRNTRLENVLAKMKGEIVHLRESKSGGERIKKLEKDLKEAEARVNDNIKRIEELVTSKSKVEAELVRMTKVCDFQMEALNHKDKKQDTKQDTKVKESEVVNKDVQKIEVKCRQFETFSRCEYGDGCRYLHPSTICEYFMKVGKCPIGECKDLHRSTSPLDMVDCHFWTSGHCKYPEAACKKGRHVAEKLGIFKKKEHFLSQGVAGRVSANHQVLGSIPPGMGGQTVGGQPVMLGQSVGGQPVLGQSMVGGQNPGVGLLPVVRGHHPMQQQGVWGQRFGMPGQQQSMPGQNQSMPGRRSGMMGGSRTILGQSFMGEEQSMLGLNQAMLGQQQSTQGQQQGLMGQQLSTQGKQEGVLGQQQGFMGQQQSFLGQQQSTQGQQLGFMGQQQSTLGQQLSTQGQQQGFLGQQQSTLGQQQNTQGQQLGTLGQQQSFLGQQQCSQGQQQGTLGISQNMGMVGRR